MRSGTHGHLPPSPHGLVVDGVQATFAQGHDGGDGLPGGRGCRGTGQEGIWVEAGVVRYVGDISCGVVLNGWRPTGDDGAQGAQVMALVVAGGEQHECCPPSIFK